MNGLPYYRAFPRDFLEGTIGMSLELKGAYRIVLDLIYMQNGRLPDDSRYIAGLLGCTPRKWTSIRGQLIDIGKLHVIGDYLSNRRAESELSHMNDWRETQAQNRRSAAPKQVNQQTKQAAKRGDAPDAVLIRTAIRAYNEAATQAGWPQTQKITEPRVKSLRARLKDVGGIEGWRAALERAMAAPHLCGQNDRKWTANFDWLIKDSNFTKLMEGNYDNRPDGPKRSGKPIPKSGDRILETIARTAKARAAHVHGGAGTGDFEP